MRKHININELEVSFNYIRKEIAECFLPFTPKARRLKKHLINLVSDINFVKDLSYTSKFEIEELLKQYPVSEDITFDINSYVYDLEIRLVYIAKYGNKIDNLSYWFDKYASTKSYIIQNSKTSYIGQSEQLTTTMVENSDEDNSQAKVIKFNHLL